ncbi:MAG: hypothetical protein WBW69_24235 [Candidatus Korobacteraceae bacterium]
MTKCSQLARGQSVVSKWTEQRQYSFAARVGGLAKFDNAGMSAERFSRILLVAGFGIWVVYGFLAGMRHWPAAVAFGLAAAICLVLLEAGRHIAIKLLDWTIVAYFGIAAIATFLVRSAGFAVYSPIVIWMLYAVVTWVSIFSGTPFSLQYARESAPPEHWQSPEFLRVNYIISIVWGVGFLINLGLVTIALAPRYNSIWLAVAAPLVIMGAASAFTWRYTKISQQRAEQAALQMSAKCAN